MLLDYGSNYNNIIKNNITNNYDGISFSGSHNTIISENIITNNEHYGIDVYGDSNTISNNSIQNNTYGGILIYHSNNNVVSGNTISNNIYDGIELTGDINTIIDNNITNNNDDGIYLWGLCYYNNIINNNISNNRCNGIQLSGKKNTISGNTIAKNKNYGINIDYKTDNNTIYYNNFIENFENAYDECENSWDDGKKGNYWNDYKEKYPNARRLWLKGIWNTPYAINGGENKDNFPLIKQINTPRNRISDISLKIFLKHNMYIFHILQKILNIIFD
jgi:parallel beta-helix repeat protein